MNGKQIEGKGATVFAPGTWTHGKPCIIGEYYEASNKYRVDFDEGWQGWYRRENLVVDGVDT